MTITSQLEETQWQSGNYFSFLFSKNGLLPQTTKSLSIVVGDNDIGIVGVKITGNGPSLSWRWYQNSTITENTGTEIVELPLNQTAIASSGAKLFIDATITGQGASATDTYIEAMGVAGKEGFYRVSEQLIVTKIAIPKNTTHTLEIANNDSVSRNAEVTITFYKIPTVTESKKY